MFIDTSEAVIWRVPRRAERFCTVCRDITPGRQRRAGGKKVSPGGVSLLRWRCADCRTRFLVASRGNHTPPRALFSERLAFEQRVRSGSLTPKEQLDLTLEAFEALEEECARALRIGPPGLLLYLLTTATAIAAFLATVFWIAALEKFAGSLASALIATTITAAFAVLLALAYRARLRLAMRGRLLRLLAVSLAPLRIPTQRLPEFVALLRSEGCPPALGVDPEALGREITLRNPAAGLRR